MRILIVLHTPRSPHSAVYISYLLLAHALERHGHTVTIMTPDDFPSLKRLHARWLPLVYPPLVARRLGGDAGGLDVVIFHSYAGWMAVRGSRRSFKAVTAFHGLEPLYYAELATEMQHLGRPLRLPFRALHGAIVPRCIRSSCRRSDAVFCLNRAEQRYLVEHRWAEPSRIQVLGHGVPAEFYVSRDYAARAQRLLFVGQWLPMKGIRYLAEAFAAVAATRPDLRLICAGTLLGPEQVAADFPAGLRSRIEVHPRVSPTELVELYRRADQFVFPSLSEGFSRALAEAMAAALPIVTTPAGAAPDLVESGVSALIVPKRDAAALERAIASLLDDETRRARLGRAAQVRAREFELGRALANMRRALEHVVGAA